MLVCQVLAAQVFGKGELFDGLLAKSELLQPLLLFELLHYDHACIVVNVILILCTESLKFLNDVLQE